MICIGEQFAGYLDFSASSSACLTYQLKQEVKTMASMNQEVKAQWTAALRSGEYKQCQRQLRSADGSGYCCLGVLTDLADKAGVVKWGHRVHPLDAIPSDEVVSWAGLEHGNPVLGGNLATWHNDHSGASFTEIADLIERYL